MHVKWMLPALVSNITRLKTMSTRSELGDTTPLCVECVASFSIGWKLRINNDHNPCVYAYYMNWHTMRSGTPTHLILIQRIGYLTKHTIAHRLADGRYVVFECKAQHRTGHHQPPIICCCHHHDNTKVPAPRSRKRTRHKCSKEWLLSL